MGKRLPLGKLNFDILERLLEKYPGVLDERLIVGPKVGEDAAVIDFPDRYLIAKTDPITFAMDEIGWYVVSASHSSAPGTFNGRPRGGNLSPNFPGVSGFESYHRGWTYGDHPLAGPPHHSGIYVRGSGEGKAGNDLRGKAGG
jgi:hypothetical protein